MPWRASWPGWARSTRAATGRLTAENLIPKILVDAYREFDSVEGRAERHARNDQLATALKQHLAHPMRDRSQR